MSVLQSPGAVERFALWCGGADGAAIIALLGWGVADCGARSQDTETLQGFCGWLCFSYACAVRCVGCGIWSGWLGRFLRHPNPVEQWHL